MSKQFSMDDLPIDMRPEHKERARAMMSYMSVVTRSGNRTEIEGLVNRLNGLLTRVSYEERLASVDELEAAVYGN